MIRNARAEATNQLGAGYDAGLLEPSPPAITTEPFFADDPVAPERDPDHHAPSLVVPAGMTHGARDWNDWLIDHPGHADWVAEHWLGGGRHLPAVPASLPTTREALHRLAAYVLAPTRHDATGRFGLRWTCGGFGTPFFGADRQIRIEGDSLIDQDSDRVRSTSITTLAAAAEFLGAEIDTVTAAEPDTPAIGDVDGQLEVDPIAASFLGAWFGMAFAALELVRGDEASADPTRPQLWPGHFDPAIEVGDTDHRGSYGASPGDGGIDEPYLYASVWWPDRVGLDQGDPFWNATTFTGRVLRLSDFAVGDPVDVAAAFWRDSRDRLG